MHHIHTQRDNKKLPPTDQDTQLSIRKDRLHTHSWLRRRTLLLIPSVFVGFGDVHQ